MSDPTPEQIKAGEDYEKLVGDVYEAHGWKVDRHGWRKQVRDRGIDLICDKPGRRVLVQCKCWAFDRGLCDHLQKFDRNVNDWRNLRGERPEQQTFSFGETLEYTLVFVVTIKASAEARALAERLGIVLKDACPTSRLEKCLNEMPEPAVRYSRRSEMPDADGVPTKQWPTKPGGCLGMVALIALTVGLAVHFFFFP